MDNSLDMSLDMSLAQEIDDAVELLTNSGLIMAAKFLAKAKDDAIFESQWTEIRRTLSDKLPKLELTPGIIWEPVKRESNTK